MKKAAILALAIPVTASVVAYWAYNSVVIAVGKAIDGMADAAQQESLIDWDYWDEWDGIS